MKKLLSIIVLCLLFSGNVFAEHYPEYAENLNDNISNGWKIIETKTFSPENSQVIIQFNTLKKDHHILHCKTRYIFTAVTSCYYP